jgi:hypothetical protein
MASSALADNHFPISKAGVGIREYLPGDIVHVIVEAPLDTNNIYAQMPDGQRVDLNLDQRTNVWNGYWQVPEGFAAGTYEAQLFARDFERKTFKGQTSPFLIGQPEMSLLVRFKTSEEVARSELQAKRLAAEADILAREAEEKAQQVQELLGKGKRQRPVPVETVEKPKTTVSKPVARYYSRPTTARARVKPRKMTTIVQKEDKITTQIRLMSSARDLLAKQQYAKAKAQLQSLLVIDPKNSGVKIIVRRLDTIVKTKNVQE